MLVVFRDYELDLRPNKKINVFRVTGLKILDRVGTHIFFNYFFLVKYIILCILKGILPFFFFFFFFRVKDRDHI